MNAREEWKASREAVTLDVPVPFNEIVDVGIFEKYALADGLYENPSQIEFEVVDGSVVAHVHLYRLNFQTDDVDEFADDYDEEDYDTICTMLDLAVVPHGEPYPDSAFMVEDPEWDHLQLLQTLEINGVLYDAYALYDED